MSDRVVLTGVGAVSCYGLGVDRFWDACLKGESVISEIPEKWYQYSDFNSNIWSPLPEFDYVALGFKSPEIKLHDKVTLHAIMASQEAISNAAIQLNSAKRNCFEFADINSDNVGVYFGTGRGGASTVAEFLGTYLSKNIRQKLREVSEAVSDTSLQDNILQTIEPVLFSDRGLSLYSVAKQMVNAAAAAIGIRFNIHGPVNNCSLACASGTAAIGHAFNAIRNKQCDIAIAGGSEYANDGIGSGFKGFDIAGTLTKVGDNIQTANCPFDEKRSGFLFSEGGAASLVLESYEHAKARNAPIIAEILAFGESFDAYNMMAIEPTGKQTRKLVKQVLHKANKSESEVDYFNAHGTGTIPNDAIEAALIKDMFGSDVLVNSTKSLMGHTIAASGAFEAIITALSIKNKTTHISKNIESPIEAINLVNKVQDYDIKLAYTQSLAFGGHNNALLIGECD